MVFHFYFLTRLPDFRFIQLGHPPQKGVENVKGDNYVINTFILRQFTILFNY